MIEKGPTHDKQNAHFAKKVVQLIADSSVEIISNYHNPKKDTRRSTCKLISLYFVFFKNDRTKDYGMHMISR